MEHMVSTFLFLKPYQNESGVRILKKSGNQKYFILVFLE